MLQRMVIAFFAFFLTSRFFSEVLGILPKWVDILDLPFIVFLGVAGLLRYAHPEVDLRTHRFLVRAIFAVTLIILTSAFMNSRDLLAPAAVLFAIGFLQGPILFIALNKIVEDVGVLAHQVRQLFLVLLAINIAVVVFINVPQFIATQNPDVVSGTYGLNAYQFSTLLVICGGLLLGEEEFRKRGKLRLIMGQTAVLVIFYLLQYRAAVPIFLLAIIVMLGALYGKPVLKVLITSVFIIAISATTISYILLQAQDETNLKYGDWEKIVANPTAFLQYGKFQSYTQTLKLFDDRPVAALAGVGPGNYLSRAYYTFSYELAGSKGKGVGDLIERLFGLSGPRFTKVSETYVGHFRSQAVLGSYQLSNPHSSFLAPVAEIGVLGGLIIIGIYLFMTIKSFKLLRQAKEIAPEFLPLATALVAGSVYLFGLAFLDNYWEMSRATLPVWLLFWGTSAGVQVKRNELEGEGHIELVALPAVAANAESMNEME